MSSSSSTAPAAATNHAFKRLAKEYSTLKTTPPANCSVQLVDDVISKWIVKLRAPSGTPYENGIFQLSFEFPDSYPMRPPAVRFLTQIYHVNVSMKQNGAICQDIVSKDWSPTLRAADIIKRCYDMFTHPNPESPLEPEIGEMLVTQPQKYKDTAAAMTKKHATGTL